jgi:peroxiredoxin
MTRRGALGGFLLLSLLTGAAAADEPGAPAARPTALGDRVSSSHSLRDLRGNRRALHDFKGHRAVVLAFLGTECPVGNLYVPRLLELEKQYRAKGVQFLAVYANEQEDLDAVAAHAADGDVPFPVLKDFGQKLADTLGVTRVPAVAVLDGDFVLRYRGRVDDRYGVAARRPRATRDDLAVALDEVLAGKKVRVAETEADGCLLDRGGNRSARAGVTYSKHVAPILQKRCQTCHRPDQPAPFALLTYDDAVKHGRMIKEVTTQRRMPPWHADPRYGHFANDRRLTRAEVETLAAWEDGGMARGDDRDLPKPVEWAQGWVHGKPDLVIPMPEAFEVPADGVLPYKNWIVETNFTEDRWVRVAEARPGTPAVVHHIVAYIMREGQRGPVGPGGTLSILVGWAPGDLGLVCPPDTALRVPKGARLRLEMHYTPNGKAVKDRSSIGVTFADRPPKYELFLSEFANTSFEVPPGDPHYRAEASLRLPADARLLSFAPHMHWRGKDYRYEVIYPDGKRQTLLSVPRWDFNWQNVYRFQEPVTLPKGSRLHAVAHWDNSANNPLNPDPKKSARFGLQTWEEMMVGFAAYVWERPETAAELAKNPPSQADQFFDRLDTNGDGFITPDEVPERLRPLLLASGVKLPDKMSREEFRTFYEEMRKRFANRRPESNPGKDGKKPDGKPEPAKPKP